MIKPGSYIRVCNPQSTYYGCVFEVVDCCLVADHYEYYNVMNELKRGEEWNYLLRVDNIDYLQEISPDDPNFPKNLLDQPVYVKARTKFVRGDMVQVTTPTGESFKARVYESNFGEHDLFSCKVSVIRIDGDGHYGECTRQRWDYLTMIQPACGDPVDYITGESIPEDDMVQALYDNRGFQIGWISWETYRRLGCFRTCECCDHLHFVSWMTRAGNDLVCMQCRNDEYVECDECGAVVRIYDSYETDDGEVLCTHCALTSGYTDTDDTTIIHNYGYKPMPIFHSDKKPVDPNDLFMGVELEVDGADLKESCAEDMITKLDSDRKLFYMKNDGSLTHGGFEIVTHPCTLQYHQQSFPWQGIIDIAREYGFTSHKIGTCGLHVHVNRCALGDNDLQRDNTAAKIVMIFDRFWDMFVRFSRRRRHALENYAFAPHANIEACDPIVNAIKKSKEACNAHYCAVNLSNHNTVEFRIFRGTLKYNTLIAALQMVSNVVELAKAKTADEISKLNWQDVINVHRYPELIQYLTERNMPGANE